MGIFKPKLNKNIQDKINKLDAKVMIAVPHVNGLPVGENALCQLYYCNDKIVIDCNDLSLNLITDNINSIVILTDVEIQQQYVSSAGGAVAGAMMFGPIGALIGGRTKKKTFRDIKKYLIITYDDNREIKHYGFDVTYTPKSNKIVKLFNKK